MKMYPFAIIDDSYYVRDNNMRRIVHAIRLPEDKAVFVKTIALGNVTNKYKKLPCIYNDFGRYTLVVQTDTYPIWVYYYVLCSLIKLEHSLRGRVYFFT